MVQAYKLIVSPTQLSNQFVFYMHNNPFKCHIEVLFYIAAIMFLFLMLITSLIIYNT